MRRCIYIYIYGIDYGYEPSHVCGQDQQDTWVQPGFKMILYSMIDGFITGFQIDDFDVYDFDGYGIWL